MRVRGSKCRECKGEREQNREGVIVRVQGSNTGSECDGDREQHGEGESMREKTQGV